jgi:hypothetical protein
MTISPAVAARRAGAGPQRRRWPVTGFASTGAGRNADGRSSVSTNPGGPAAPGRASEPINAEPDKESGKVLNGSAFSAQPIGHSPARVRAGDSALWHRGLRRDLFGVAMTARMWAAVENARRWGAAGVFRLASLLLRHAMFLHRQRRISHNSLRTVLSGTRSLERFGALLALGRRRKSQEPEKDFHRDRFD